MAAHLHADIDFPEKEGRQNHQNPLAK
jgi:hypothetical protein